MKRLVLLGALFGLSSCYRMTIRSDGRADGQGNSDTNASFAWGAAGATTYASECKDGIQQATVYWPWWSPLVYFVTAGLVAPITTEYRCATVKP